MEVLDVVNDKNQVIGKATRQGIYEQKLSHRIVHVIVFNSNGQMALQRRSPNARAFPFFWSTSAGGHVQSGESYEEAALREYEEELHTTSELTRFTEVVFHPENYPKKFLTVFHAEHDGLKDIQNEEVYEVHYRSLEAIQQMIADGEKFHPELLFLLEKFYF